MYASNFLLKDDSADSEKTRSIAPANLQLPIDGVHVWRAQLDEACAPADTFAQILGRRERDRALRFHFERDRKRFISSHVILHQILERYFENDPSRLEFFYGSYGKPYVRNQDGDTLGFNMAHSRDIALYAFARTRQIGVDIECVESMLETASIAQTLFSERERAAWRAVSADKQQEVFFNWWTLKEAYGKALGYGLNLSPDQFPVLPPDTKASSGLYMAEIGGKNAAWSFKTFAPVPGYVAAIGVEGSRRALNQWDWSPC